MGSSSTEADLHTRIQQQEVVAELGQQALETDDVDQLMHDASQVVADTLDNEYCKVLELLPGGDEVFLRQGVGWRDGLVGDATVPTDTDSQAGYTLLSEEPIIVDDLRTEERFSGPDLLTSHDVVSGISVIVGSIDEPWGVLGTHTTERREFTEDDANFVQSVANILASAIENERTQSELEEIYGRISDAFFGLDEDWRFTFLNERAHELINPEGRTLVGKRVWDEFPEAIGRKFKPKYDQAMYEQETVSFEEYYPEPLDIWADVRAYPSETGLSVYFQDVTERKERERALEQSEQRYRTLAECFPNGVVTLFDDDLRYTLAAGQAFETLPVSRADLENRTPREAWGDDVADALEPMLQAALDGEDDEVELSYVGRDWVVHTVPVTDEHGDVFAGMTMAQDITERKEHERELERALDLLEKTERIADVGGWEIDVETQEVFWTDHIFELLEVDADQEPSLDKALAMYHEEDRQTVEASIEEALDSGDPFDVEARIRTNSGEVRWLRLQGTPEIIDDDVVSLRGAAQDVTEHKRREQRLEELIDRLEESNERLEQFAYAASHDLQEPLRMVSSYLQLIESRYEDQLGEEGQEFLEFAVDGADRMREMIEGLLQYSRVDTRGDPFEPVDLDAVFANVRQDLEVSIEESDAEITAEDLPHVYGDGGQLNQVFQNLLSNAIEYSGDEPPRVHVSAEQAGDEWVIAVSDEGIGMDPAEADRAFQVFESLHSRDEHAGTGIGLALCERIVQRHGGEIRVDSEPGEGATFSFTLPAADDRDE